MLKNFCDLCGIFDDCNLFFIENLCMMSLWKVVLIVVLLVGVLGVGVLLSYVF